MKIIFVIFIYVVLSSFLFSIVINVPAEQPTIQSGINASVNTDTVLVQSGTYYENINYNGKNITVASLFLTTQDTTYISQTIIDGNQNGSVVIFESGEDSTAVLCGVTVTNGLGGGIFPDCFAGGITCTSTSSPKLENLIITGNDTSSEGGGIYCYFYSSPRLKNVEISGNSAETCGGGIYCSFQCMLNLDNVVILGNSVESAGGGIYCSQSDPIIKNTIISCNTALYGGGIHCGNSLLSLNNVVISDNSVDWYGGGISCTLSSPSIINTTISSNNAGTHGGGIFCHYNSNPSITNSILWDDSPVEIGFNDSGELNSINISYSDIQGGEAGIVTNNNGTVNWLDGNIDDDPLFVDPLAEDYHLTADSPCINAGDPSYPLDPDNTICDMGAYFFNQYDGPTWHISTTGSNITGSGSEQYPFATIQHGIDVSSDTDIVLVQPGTYMENINYNGKNITVGSLYITTQDTAYISQTIIDGNQNGSVVTFESGEDSTAVLTGFTITNGLGGGWYPDCYAGGITCTNTSNPNLENLKITGNYTSSGGGGIYCYFYSSPRLENVVISDNSAETGGGGIYCYFYSSPRLENVVISDNSVDSGGGGGIDCSQSDLSLENTIIKGNTALYGGGIRCSMSDMNLINVTISGNSVDWHGGGISCSASSPSIINATITGNTAYYAGGILCNHNSNPVLINCILWNQSPQEIYFFEGNASNSITISYSDIDSGEVGIVTNNNGTVIWLEGNIDDDPLFVDPLNGNFHLTENSPCIDAGDPNFPFDPDNTICDMGAYYYHQDQDIVIDEIYPEPDSLFISEGDSINFYIYAIDPDGNPIEYCWELEDEIVGIDSCYTFLTDENSAGEYRLLLEITDNYQPPSRDSLAFVWNIIVDEIVSVQDLVPQVTNIYQNFPNPFNPITTINYDLSQDSDVQIEIYNIKGQKVKQLVNEQKQAGKYSVNWNGKNDNGRLVSSGIYFYKMKSVDFEKTRKMLLLK